tara:strand:- start:1145 stop:1777 length:633 start_codon:yes stop_codon:yes gene_type:complete
MIRNTVFYNHKHIDLNDDDWPDILLKHNDENSEFSGIWWLRDHVFPSTLFTMDDLTLIDIREGQFWKYVYTISSNKNWVRNEKTCFSMLLSCYYSFISPRMTLYRSADKKWFRIGKKDFQYMRIIDQDIAPHIYISNPGDFLRLNLDEERDVSYMYIIQKVAYKQNNVIKKTNAFKTLKQRINTNSKSFVITCGETPPFDKINPNQMVRI